MDIDDWRANGEMRKWEKELDEKRQKQLEELSNELSDESYEIDSDNLPSNLEKLDNLLRERKERHVERLSEMDDKTDNFGLYSFALFILAIIILIITL